MHPILSVCNFVFLPPPLNNIQEDLLIFQIYLYIQLYLIYIYICSLMKSLAMFSQSSRPAQDLLSNFVITSSRIAPPFQKMARFGIRLQGIFTKYSQLCRIFCKLLRLKFQFRKICEYLLSLYKIYVVFLKSMLKWQIGPERNFLSYTYEIYFYYTLFMFSFHSKPT